MSTVGGDVGLGPYSKYFCVSHKYQEVCKHDDTEYNPIPAEDLKVVLFDEIHQEADGKQGNKKCDQHPRYQNNGLQRGKVETKFGRRILRSLENFF